MVIREGVVVFCSVTMGDMKKSEARQTAISLCCSHVNKVGAKPCIKVDHMCTGAGVGPATGRATVI